MMPSIMGFPLGPNTQAQKKSMPNYGVWSAINQKKEKWFEKIEKFKNQVRVGVDIPMSALSLYEEK